MLAAEHIWSPVFLFLFIYLFILLLNELCFVLYKLQQLNLSSA